MNPRFQQILCKRVSKLNFMSSFGNEVVVDLVSHLISRTDKFINQFNPTQIYLKWYETLKMRWGINLYKFIKKFSKKYFN